MVSVRLPSEWHELLHNLRPDGLPQVTPLNLELERLVEDLVPRLRDRRGWEVLCAVQGGENLKVIAVRFGVTAERLRRLHIQSVRELRVTAFFEAWASQLYGLAQSPRVVEVPLQAGNTWRVLISLARSTARPDLYTHTLAPGLWVLVRLPGGADLRHRTLLPGRYYPEAEAAAHLRLPGDLLRVAWPAMQVERTVGGQYAARQDEWSSADWLAAVARALAEAGFDTWEARHLYAAMRSLPNAPDVLDSTLRTALRKGAHFEHTPLRGVWRWRAPLAEHEETAVKADQSRPSRRVDTSGHLTTHGPDTMTGDTTTEKECRIGANDRTFLKCAQGVSRDE